MTKKQKAFYVISALLDDSSTLGKLKRCETEAEAIAHAKSVIARRASQGDHPLTFHVLKVIMMVEPVSAPVRVTKLR